MDKYLGKRLDGRYEIREIIGVGGMAVVYKAYDSVDEKIVAIKILKEEFTGNEEFLRRFKNESKAIAVLSHPNIVKVFDVSFGDLIQYIVMEYIEGITLKEYIDKQGPLSWSDAVRFALQILRGLQHAHDKGVVHRDVKPQNIMVLSDGTIKVTDFGIARFARSEQRTITDKAIGSVHYISPEQARGENTDDKADIYSVGVMLYEMITGQLPFQAESAVSVAIMQLQKDPKLPREINGSIPLGLEQITMHAMQKEAPKRYKSAAEMLCDLEEFKKNPATVFDYDYFVDDAPTKFIPINAEEEEEESEKSPLIPILAGVSATFVIAIIVLAIFLGSKFLGNKTEEILCDSFIGMHYTEVQSNDDYKDIYDIVYEYVPSSEYEQGKVFKQNPTAGKSIKKGGKLTLYVSLGEKTVLVPNVYELPAARAKNELESKGFVVIEKEISSTTIPVGNVVRTEPGEGSEIIENSEVTIFISTGAPETPVRLPDLIGLSKSDAEAELNRSGLQLGEVTEIDSFDAAGIVSTQVPSLKDTDTVNKGSSVNIGISKGYAVFDLTLDIPDDYENHKAYISLWDENESKIAISDGLIDLSTSDYKYVFKSLMINKKNTLLTVKLSDAKDIGVFYSVLQIRITDTDGKFVVTLDNSLFEYPRLQMGNDIVDENSSDGVSSFVQNNGSSDVNNTTQTNPQDTNSDSVSSNISSNKNGENS